LSNTNNKDTSNTVLLFLDNESPDLTTKNITIKINETGKSTISANDLIDTMYDNCNIADTTLNQYDFYPSDIGDNEIIVTAIDDIGNETQRTAIVTVDQATMLREYVTDKHAISLSPNPAHNNIYLIHNNEKIYQVNIFNISGTKISTPSPDNDKIDISNLEKGIYVVQIKTKENIFNLKFIKQ